MQMNCSSATTQSKPSLNSSCNLASFESLESMCYINSLGLTKLGELIAATSILSKFQATKLRRAKRGLAEYLKIT